MDSLNVARVWSVDAGVEDARKTLRYEVRAHAVFRWVDRQGVSQECDGFTRDVSPKGAYIFASECPPRGTPMEMTIALPSAGKGTGNLHIRADCCVLRTEKVRAAQGTVGFSVQNSRVTLCPD